MARITVEDCIDKVENRFDLVLLAGHRARMIANGSPLTIDRDNDKNPVVALREIADETVDPDDLREDLIHSMQRHVEVDEPEEAGEAVAALPAPDDPMSSMIVNSEDQMDGDMTFGSMSEEDLLRGLEGLVPPERSDET